MRTKFCLVSVFFVIFLGIAPLAQALTYNQIVAWQTLGRVLGASTNVSFTMGSSGLSSLIYNGQDFHYNTALQIIQVSLVDSNGTVTAGNTTPLTTTNTANSITKTFSWGSVTLNLSTNGSTLIGSTTFTNSTPDKTIKKIWLYPFGITLPQTPTDVTNNTGFGVDAPTINGKDWGTGAVMLVGEDVAKPLGLGFRAGNSPATVNWYISTFISDALNFPTSGYPATPRSIGPGATDVFNFSLRFGPSGSTTTDLAADVYQRFSQAFPFQLNWPDRRPIADDFMASGGQKNSVTNPRGYNIGGASQCTSPDVSTPSGITTFQQCVMARTNSNINRMKTLNAQGIIIWDIEGIEFPSAVYLGSPDSLPQLSPEMDGIADQMFAAYKNAGFKVGVTIRPDTIAFTASPRSATRVADANASAAVQTIINKIRYAKNRWGATLFYLDSNVEATQNSPYPTSVFSQITQTFPDILILPEWKSVQYFQISAPFTDYRNASHLATLQSAQLTYPQSVAVFYNIPGTPNAQQTQSLIANLKAGSIPFVDAWYNSATNASVQNLYSQAGITFTSNSSAPTISSFTASSASITSGQSTTLSWSVSGATGLSIDNGVGTVSGTSQSVSPTQTTTYTLTATNSSGAVTKTVTVTVNPAVVVDTTPPILSSINLSGVTQSSATMSWTTDENSDTQVDYGTTASYGSSSVLNPALSLSHITTLTSLTPATLYHYRVKSKDASGNLAVSADQTFTTTAVVSGAPVISTFSASPLNITAGLSSTLSFVATGATSLTIDNGLGTVTGQTSVTITPAQTTTYTLTATNASGSTSATVTVTVNIPVVAPPVSTPPSTVPSSFTGSTVVSGITVDNSQPYTAFISWTTDHADGGFVQYGTTSSYGQNTDPSGGTSHTVQVLYLNPNTTYHYRIVSLEQNGSQTVSSDATFTTTLVPTQTTPAPLATNPSNPTNQALSTPSQLSANNIRLVNSSGTFYIVTNGQRRGVTNPGMLNTYGLSFSDAQAATAQDSSLPVGGLILPNDGSLVKSKQDLTVYLISNGQRYGFTSAKVFTSLGFKFSSVLVVTDPELQDLPKASNISSGSSAHLPGTDISYKGTIYWIGQDNQRHAYSSASDFNSWHLHNNYSRVTPANAADLKIPLGTPVIGRVVG